MEDLTDPEQVRTDPKCDRTVSLYGYLRGAHLKNKSQVHIPGTLSRAVMCSGLKTFTHSPSWHFEIHF